MTRDDQHFQNELDRLELERDSLAIYALCATCKDRTDCSGAVSTNADNAGWRWRNDGCDRKADFVRILTNGE